MNIALIGIDLGKNFMYLHCVDMAGKEVLKRRVCREELLRFLGNLHKTRVVMEACGGSNYWAREIEKLGHSVQLIAAQYVKPYVMRNKTDWKDAEAICVAASQANMRYVPRKDESQQDIQSLHRIRERLIKARTALVNEARGLLGEYGVIIPKGRRVFTAKFLTLINQNEDRLSSLGKETFNDLWDEYFNLEKRIETFEKKLTHICKTHPVCQRLMSIPGVGYLTSTAMLAAVKDIGVFKNGRELASWLGLTPREYSTGGKQKLYGISKRGNTYLRKLLIHGARITLRYLNRHKDRRSIWANDLLRRKGVNRTAVAVANKNARVIWALIKTDKEYQTYPVAA